MKVDFGQPLKTLDGVVIVDADKSDETSQVEVTLKTVAINALTAAYADEKDLSGEDKLKRWELARKIHGGNNEVSAEDVSLLKKLIGKAYGVAIVGPAYGMLEGN